MKMLLVDKILGYYGSQVFNSDNIVKISCIHTHHKYHFNLEIYIENHRDEMIRLYNRIHSNDEYPALVEELYPKEIYRIANINNLELLILTQNKLNSSITGISYDKFRCYSEPISFIKTEMINNEYWFKIANDNLDKNFFFWSIDPEEENSKWIIYDLSIKRVELKDSGENNKFTVRIYLIPLFKHS